MYEYEILYYYDEQIEAGRGLVAGVNSMYEATKKLLDYYGENEVQELHLKFIAEQSNVFVYKKNVASLVEHFDIV